MKGLFYWSIKNKLFFCLDLKTGENLKKKEVGEAGVKQVYYLNISKYKVLISVDMFVSPIINPEPGT